MYDDVLETIANAAVAKKNLLSRRPLAALVHSMLAGAYVGLGIVLIFMLGTPLFKAQSPFQSLVMGGAFGIALSLVILAGSDLFTGNTLVMPIGAWRRRCSWGDVLQVWMLSFVGNLLGSMLVAALAASARIFSDPALVAAVAGAKMQADPLVLVSKAILCNWLVCLAVWCGFRLKSEAGKLIMIWWCLLGFIASGYEHSVANMTLLSLANLLPHGAGVSWAGAAYNLALVTLGNTLSGMVLVAGAYYFVNGPHQPAPASFSTALDLAPPTLSPASDMATPASASATSTPLPPLLPPSR